MLPHLFIPVMHAYRKDTANEPEIAEAILSSQLIYILGGFTHYLGQTLTGSKSYQAMRKAYDGQAVIAGSSAGAMVLCEHYYHHMDNGVVKGLNFISGACVLPHHDTFGKTWASRLTTLLPDVILIGIDEQTGMMNDSPNGLWQAYGKGRITLYRTNGSVSYLPGEPFTLNIE